MLPWKSWSPRPIFERKRVKLKNQPPTPMGVFVYNKSISFLKLLIYMDLLGIICQIWVIFVNWGGFYCLFKWGRGNHHVTATLVTTQAVLQAAPHWTCTEWVICIAGIYVASSRQFSWRQFQCISHFNFRFRVEYRNVNGNRIQHPSTGGYSSIRFGFSPP